MSVNSNILLASAQQAKVWLRDETYHHTPSDAIEWLSINNITDLELAILWAIIDEIEFDFDEHELEFIDRVDESTLYLLPDSMIFSLARLTDDEIAIFSQQWADTEEMQWPPEQALNLLTALVTLAIKAKQYAKSLYLWSPS